MSKYADDRDYNYEGSAFDFDTAGITAASGTWVKIVSSLTKRTAVSIVNMNANPVLIGPSGYAESELYPLASGVHFGVNLRDTGPANSGLPEVAIYAYGDVNSGGVNIRIFDTF